MLIKKNINYAASPIGRLYYLDWLRILAIFAVFFYHCNRFFDYKEYAIQSITRSLFSTIHREFFQIWLMPVFFVISGAAVSYSLKSGRKVLTFIKDKIYRLLFPLVFIGIFIVAPPQVYLERLTQGQFIGSFLQWIPQYFHGIYPHGNFSFTGMHCWYLLNLFLYSLIFLPLFIPLGKTKKSILSRFSVLFEKPWALLLLSISVAASSISAEALGLGTLKIMGGWDPLSYPLFFIFGYVIFSNTRIHEIIKKYSKVCLITAIIFTGLYLYLEFGTGLQEISVVAKHKLIMETSNIKDVVSFKVSVPWAGILVMRSFLAWTWIISFLGFGAKFLNFKNRFMEYANEAILPFYILHQTILLIIGYYVIQWNTNIAVEYAFITISSFTIIMLIYELLVRRNNILRQLFGMKFKIKH
jgi:glucans biosynthesis protein C